MHGLALFLYEVNYTGKELSTVSNAFILCSIFASQVVLELCWLKKKTIKQQQQWTNKSKPQTMLLILSISW